MKTKLVYIAHQVNGDVEGNIKKILKLCRAIHLRGDSIIPFAPYIASLQYLDDNKPDERKLGIAASEELFRRRAFDELWVCGEKISAGMEMEIKWAEKYQIPVKYDNFV